MISEISGELFRNIKTLSSGTKLINRIKKYSENDNRGFITEEKFEKDFKIVVIKDSKAKPYLITKHMSSILDSLGLHQMHIVIAREIIDKVYEASFYKEKEGVATWKAEELTDFTVEALEDMAESRQETFLYDGVNDYAHTHKRGLVFRKENN